MSKKFENNNHLIDYFLDRLVALDLIHNNETQKIEFSAAQDLIKQKIDKLREWGGRLGATNIFSFEEQELKATPLINSITNLKSLIRTSSARVESFVTVKQDLNTGKYKEVIDYDMYIKSSNRSNHVETEILELLDMQQLFLNEVRTFIDCVNKLETLERKLIYYHYLKLEKESLLMIQTNRIEGCSKSTIYRMRDKATISLAYNLMGISA